jgi:hypothetical protein
VTVHESPTTIRIDGDLAITLSAQERRRLLIRVLCELIAYGEDALPSDTTQTLVETTRTGR